MSTTRKIRCTDCGETVPYGRLSCPSCGTLLASVAGSTRQSSAASARAAAAELAVAAMNEAAEAAAAAEPAETEEPIEAEAEDAPAPPPAESSAPAMLLPRAPKPTAPSGFDPRRSAAPHTLVPTTVVRSANLGDFAPASSGAAVATWPGGGMSASSSASAVTSDAVNAASSRASDAMARVTGRLDLSRLGQGLDWAAAIGSGLVAMGLLLPWSSSVIGATEVNGYFDTWGVAGPGHVVVLFWSIAVLGLSLVPNRVPRWVRTGVASLALGIFSLGLAWPYLIGPLGADIGVVAMAVGAFVLIPTGILADWYSRHAPAEPPV